MSVGQGTAFGRTQAAEAWGSALLGVVIFSGSLPATRIALGGFPPLFLTSARAVIAALLGAAFLLLLRQRRPARRNLLSLAVVALGVVVGFWYRGLVLGGIAAVGQLQLLQPFLSFGLVGMLLHEPISWTMVAATGLVGLCVAGAKHFL